MLHLFGYDLPMPSSIKQPLFCTKEMLTVQMFHVQKLLVNERCINIFSTLKIIGPDVLHCVLS
jgi:hypothetical protein